MTKGARFTRAEFEAILAQGKAKQGQGMGQSLKGPKSTPEEAISASEGFFIPGNVPSKKNDKRFVGRDKSGKAIVSQSRPFREYHRRAKQIMGIYSVAFRRSCEGRPKPLRVLFRFVRASKARFDYTNAAQTVEDLMTECGWIDDDNANELLPVFEPYELSKTQPGVWVKVL